MSIELVVGGTGSDTIGLDDCDLDGDRRRGFCGLRGRGRDGNGDGFGDGMGFLLGPRCGGIGGGGGPLKWCKFRENVHHQNSQNTVGMNTGKFALNRYEMTSNHFKDKPSGIGME